MRKQRTEPYGFKSDGTPICYARLKAGGRCQQDKISRANFRCRMHSGTQRRGAANPSTRTGRYSVDLPTRLLSRYEDLMADDTLLSLRDDIALLGANIGEELEEIKKAESEPDIDAFIGMAERIAQNWQSWDWTQMNKEMADLIDVAKGRQRRRDAMFNIRSLIRDKAALVAQENKLMAERDSMIPVDQVILLMRAIAGIVRREVREPDTLRTIEAEFARVVNAVDEPKALR